MAFGLLAAVLACNKAERKADSTVFLDVVDINAKVAPPPPEPPKVGRIPVFATPIGGTCRVARYRGRDAVAREIFYDADQPRRQIVVGISRMPRIFPAEHLEIIATRGDGVTNEQETIIAGFSGDSTVKFGTRTYAIHGREEAVEKTQLSDADKLEAVRFTRAIMTLCPEGLR